MKILLFSISLLLFVLPLEAQRYCWGQKYCWGCRRYMDFYLAGYDGIPYGYIDNINYPDTYHLPRNPCFNYRPPCCYNSYNHQYFRNCLRYTCEIHSNPPCN